MKFHMSAIAAAVVALGLAAAPSWATTVFNVAWSGARFGNTATASGQITIDETLLPNPGSYSDVSNLPPWLTALTITVTGAGAGDGIFTLADFSGAYWDTNGATLDLGTQLIGQPTMGAAWGTTPSSGGVGDFNLFGSAANAPNGTWYFTLTSRSDPMYLTYFGIPGSPAPVLPEPASIALLLAGLAGAGAMVRRRPKA